MSRRSAVTDAPKGGVATSIVVRLFASHNLLLAALRRGLGPSLTLARFDLLAQLAREDGVALATLSRRMLVTAGNLTGLVDRAERDGLVKRRPDANDGRVTRVFLTARGQRLADEAVRQHNALTESLLGGLDADTQRTLRDALGQLRTALEAQGAVGDT